MDRRSFLETVAGALVVAPLAACSSSRTITDPSPPPAGPTVNVAVRLDRTRRGARLSRRFAGLSYEKTRLAVPLFTPANAAYAALLALVGPGVLRIGANGVDRSSWRGAVPGLTPITPAQVDAFCQLMVATGWRVIWGIGLAQNTPAAAADEAAYVAARLGANLLAFEFGNEPDLYHSNGLRAPTYAYADWLAEWRAMAAAVRAAVPGAALSGPAAAYDAPRYTVPFARDAGRDVALLTQHYYRADGQAATSTLDLLLQPHPALAAVTQQCVAAAAQAGIAQGYRVAECNSFYDGGAPQVSASHGTALWVLDYLFTVAMAGATGVNFHGGGNGPGYTPIADGGGAITGVRPGFHGILCFALAADGAALAATATPDAPANVTAWGVARDDGGTNVVLVNKDATRSAVVTLDAGAAIAAWRALALAGPALDALTGTTLGGVPVSPGGAWTPAWTPVAGGAATRLVVPPAGAVLLRSA